MDNKKISEVFEEMGDILDIQGADFFRVNAYKKAAMTVLNFAEDLREMVDKSPNEISKIPGIGKALQEKIIELVLTGKCKEHEDIKNGFPIGLLEILKVRTIGPKKVKLFYSKLGIKNIKELKLAAKSGKIGELEGMGEKSESEILKAIEEHSRFSTDRSLIHEAMQEALRIIEYMKSIKDISKIQYAGSLRRSEETIGDIDILVSVIDPEKTQLSVMDHFIKYPDVLTVIAHGDTKSSVLLIGGIHVDLRVVSNKSFGAALHYFTGNKAHNILIRDLAKKKGLKINEYGIFKGDKMIGGEAEEDIFKSVGLPYLIPEIRQGDIEIEYALNHKKLPHFIELSDIKGDLHVHSTYSDGTNSIEDMALACIERGYEYFAMTDHSSLVGVTGGMGTDDIKRQWKEIDKLNKRFKGQIKILKGSEVDIRKDGSLDFSDDILKELDIVIASAHLYSHLSFDEQTARLISAIENPYVKILGHPSGRLINKRPEMLFDMEKIIDAAVKNKVALEINSNPMRLDLSSKYVRLAKERDAKFVINTDSHSVDQLSFMDFGLGIARRGWLDKTDVLNANPLVKFDN